MVADFQLCEAMLRYFFRKAQPPGWRLRRGRCWACPAASRRSSVGRSSTASAAPARQVWLIGKAKAAAIGAGLPLAEPLASMICNVGGGNTEIAVFSLAQPVAEQSIRTGGDHMDRAIADYLRRHYSLRIGLPTAERLRIDLGSAAPLEEELVAEVSGLDTASGLPRKATVTSEEVRQALGDPLEAILEAVKRPSTSAVPTWPPTWSSMAWSFAAADRCCGGWTASSASRRGCPSASPPTRWAPWPRDCLICLEHLRQWRPSLQSSDEDV